MDVNYRNKRHYKTAKYPIRQPKYLTWLIQVLSKLMLFGKEYKVEKIGMNGLKPPYILLSNHMSFIDFELVSLGTYPNRVNNVVNIDGFYRRPWLLEWIGAICTRKFTTDYHLVKSIRRVLERGDILCMYPEARYSPCGTTSYIPETVGALVKMNKVPVVVAIHRGNYLRAPFWGYHKKRKLPLYTTLTQIISAEDAHALSTDEINARIAEAFKYDEYRYQKDNGIIIDEPFRADGLHKILYHCPHCKTEFKMESKGADIFCTECGKNWHLREDGELEASDGETEFTRIPDWFEWERASVRAEIESGTYRFEDECEVYSLPRCYKFHKLGKALLIHDPENGFVLQGFYRDCDYHIHRAPLETNSLHVEYDFPHVKGTDCIDISTTKDSFYCFPSNDRTVTKLSLATEEIYKLHYARIRK